MGAHLAGSPPDPPHLWEGPSVGVPTCPQVFCPHVNSHLVACRHWWKAQSPLPACAPGERHARPAPSCLRICAQGGQAVTAHSGLLSPTPWCRDAPVPSQLLQACQLVPAASKAWPPHPVRCTDAALSSDAWPPGPRAALRALGAWGAAAALWVPGTQCRWPWTLGYVNKRRTGWQVGQDGLARMLSTLSRPEVPGNRSWRKSTSSTGKIAPQLSLLIAPRRTSK